MPEFIPRLRIFVSSPGDVSEERRIAREVIERLPREPLLEGKVAMDAVMWDAPSAPVPLAANETPQASVNRYKGLASDCDLVVVILWRRMGTPLAGELRKADGSAYRSGTEFEFEDAVAHGRTCWIYHRTEPFEPTSDHERLQKDGVRDFLDEVRGHPGEPARGGVIEYASSSDFGPLFEKHLEAFVRSWLDGDGLGSGAAGEQSPNWLLKSLVSVSTLGSDSRVTIRGPAGSLIAPREYWPEFTDVQRTYQWFVGRVEMLGRAAAFFDRHSCGYFRIVGGAGLGKTALAVEMARRYRAPAYFVSGPAGRTMPEHILGSLCAQVIIRYELPHGQVPVRAGESGDALFSLLQEAAAKSGNRPVVIVIDGLDEVDATPAGHNWLHLPKALPQNVYVVLLQRPGEFPLVVDPGVAVEATNIEDDPDAQRRDVEAYLRHEADRADVAASLKRPVPPIEPETLVTRLAEASEGNFMYLSYMLGDIASAPAGPDFDELPSGLEGYYRSVWTQLSEGKKSDRATWKAVQRPVLSLLAAAREPVTAEWLAKHSGADPDDVRELALVPWSRFLARSVRAPKWRVLHKSFSDFLAARSEIDLPWTHAHIAEYYSKDLSRAEADDGYAYRQLSAHLIEAGLLDDLGALIEREDWYRGQRRRDPSGHGYSVDVMRAITLARTRGTPEVGAVAAWSMLYGTVATMASEVPEDALVALVVLGNEELALSLASLVTDAEKRLSAHVRIASSLLDLQKQEAAASAATLAAAIMPEIWPGNRPGWISPIVDLLSRAGHADMARALLSNVNDESDDPEDAAGEKAIDKDEKADDAEASYLALNDFVRRLVSAGERIDGGETSTQTIDDAFHGVSRLSDDIQRRSLTAITNLIDKLTTANDEHGLARLEETILRYDGPASASFLGLLAAARALAGDIDRARRLLREAENRVAASHPDPWIADTIVGEIAARRVQVEGHTALAGALARIENISQFHYGATLTWITRILQGTSDLQGLRDIFGRADRVADDQRAELFGALAEAFLAANMDGDADEVWKAAAKIVAREPRLAAVSAVCLSYARAGRRVAALQTIDRVVAETQTTPYSSGEIRALCGLAAGLEASGMHEAALDALTLAERASDPKRSYGRDRLAISVSQLRNQTEGRAMLDALVSTIAAEEKEYSYNSGEALASLAQSMATIGHSDGLTHLRAFALDALSYAKGKARVLIEIGDAQSRLEHLDDAAVAFGESLTLLLGDAERRKGDSFSASTLFSWLDKLVSAARTEPELVAKLRARSVLDRAIAMAEGTKDKEWGGTVRSGAARLLAHMRDPVAGEKLRAAVAVQEPDRSAQIRAEQAIVAAADGDRGKASELLRAGRADAERGLLDRPDLPDSLVALVNACSNVGDANELSELAVVGDRLHPEAHAMFLFAMADARIKLGQFELARTAVATSIRLALAAEAKVTLTEPAYIAWYIRETMTTLAGHSEPIVESWVADLLTAALRLGRESVLTLLSELAPVLQRLGASSSLWQHWQHIDALLVRSPAPGT